MFKAIIIDDEEYIIDGLKRHIDWSGLGVTIIDTAVNGKDGLDKIRIHNPDIVMTDIKMPLMDGLEMISQAKKEGYNPKVLIITGHDEFNYAKEGIKLGVNDYILKPSMPEEIVLVLNKVIRACQDEKAREIQFQNLREKINESIPVLQEKLVEELLEGIVVSEREFIDRTEFLGLNLNNKLYQAITLHIEYFKDFLEDNNEEYRQLVKLAILNKARDYLKVERTYLNFKKKNAHLLLVSDKEVKESEKLINEIMLKIIDECKDEFSISLSIGVGQQFDKFSDIKHSFDQSTECLKYKTQFGEGKVIFYEDILFTNLTVPVLNLYNREDLIDGLKSRDATLVNKCVDDMFIKVEEQKYIKIEYLKVILIEMLGIVSLTLFQIGENKEVTSFGSAIFNSIEDLETVEEIEACLKEAFTGILSIISNKSNQRCNRVVEQIVDFIKENYNKEISLDDISKRIYLTPNYLSNIFSNGMGESFTKYLARYRIEKAKELLESGKYKIYELCEMVGYKNVDYFRKVFKEFTGRSPSEF